MPAAKNDWAELLPCPACTGLIPAYGYAAHTSLCAEVSSKMRHDRPTFFSKHKDKDDDCEVCFYPLDLDPAAAVVVKAEPQGPHAPATDGSAALAPPSSASSFLTRFCPLRKKDCIAHVLWQDLRRAQLMQQFDLHRRRLQRLSEEAKRFYLRIQDREDELLQMYAAAAQPLPGVRGLSFLPRDSYIDVRPINQPALLPVSTAVAAQF